MQCCSCCTTHSTGRTQVQNTPAGGGARACDVQPRSMLASGASSHISPSSANNQPLSSAPHQQRLAHDARAHGRGEGKRQCTVALQPAQALLAQDELLQRSKPDSAATAGQRTSQRARPRWTSSASPAATSSPSRWLLAASPTVTHLASTRSPGPD